MLGRKAFKHAASLLRELQSRCGFALLVTQVAHHVAREVQRSLIGRVVGKAPDKLSVQVHGTTASLPGHLETTCRLLKRGQITQIERKLVDLIGSFGMIALR